jgi:hypothetical protein
VFYTHRYFKLAKSLGSFERNVNAKWIFELVSPPGVAELSGIQNKVTKILKVTKLRDGRRCKIINVLGPIHTAFFSLFLSIARSKYGKSV